VHLRAPKEMKVAQVIEQFAVNTECPVLTVEGTTRHVNPAWRWRTEPIESVRVHNVYAPREAIDYRFLLTPVEKRLDEFDFCEGILGRIWIWLLRDSDGKPVIEYNYLRMHNTLALAGQPASWLS